MKFAHLSDCHIGGWQESTLRDLNLKSFQRAIDISIKENVDFILIAGDLFDTSLPSIDVLKETASILKNLSKLNIPVYLIPGSHDFSVSGKTMLDVLENAGLIINVMKFEEDKLKFTIDPKTQIHLTGFYGKKGSLEHSEYSTLEKSHLESNLNKKIFLFHSLINDLKPKIFEHIEGLSLNALPKNFDYYAGGHPHFIYSEHHKDFGIIAYPGPIFPNNFQELESLKHGGFFIVNLEDNIISKHIPLNIIEVSSYFFDADNKTPQKLDEEILSKVKDFNNKIITLRIEGTLESGKTSDINFKIFQERFKSAYCLLKNTHKLKSKEFDSIDVDTRSVLDIEFSLIKESLSQSKFAESTISNLISYLDKEKFEGEKSSDFELRIINDCKKMFELD